MFRILIAGPIHEAGRALLDARTDIEYEMLNQATAAEVDSRIADLDAVLLRLTPLTAEMIEKAGKLKVVSRYGVGYDSIDVDALTKRRIPLVTVGDTNAATVAEHTIGLMIAVSRQMVVMDRLTRAGGWGLRNESGITELQGKTVVVVGFGRIGRKVASRAAAFDMTIVIADPFVEHEVVEALGYRHVTDFHDVLEEADYVTLHLPAAPDGRPVMGAAEFSKMKRGAYFINAARGTLIDEDALTAALTEGHLHGAGLDVMRDEPPSHDNPLLSLDNVVFSPHNAALTEECAQRMSEISVRKILDTFDGRLDPEFVVNRDILRQC